MCLSIVFRSYSPIYSISCKCLALDFEKFCFNVLAEISPSTLTPSASTSARTFRNWSCESRSISPSSLPSYSEDFDLESSRWGFLFLNCRVSPKMQPTLQMSAFELKSFWRTISGAMYHLATIYLELCFKSKFGLEILSGSINLAKLKSQINNWDF